ILAAKQLPPHVEDFDAAVGMHLVAFRDRAAGVALGWLLSLHADVPALAGLRFRLWRLRYEAARIAFGQAKGGPFLAWVFGVGLVRLADRRRRSGIVSISSTPRDASDYQRKFVLVEYDGALLAGSAERGNP